MDYTETAASVVSQAIGENLFDGSALPIKVKDTIFAERARKAGLAGGKARAKKLSAKRRTQIASRAAKSRWKK